MVLPIIAGILAVFGAVAGFTQQAIQFLGSVISSLWNIIRLFIDNAPQPLRIFVFLFLLVSAGNLIGNLFLSSMYACDSVNTLYKAPDLITGVFSGLSLGVLGAVIGDRDTYIQSHYDVQVQSIATTNVRCADNTASLFFYNIRLLDYKLWLLLCLLLYGTPLAWQYYQRMGVLH